MNSVSRNQYGELFAEHEFTVLSFHDLVQDNPTHRIDSEYFQKRFLKNVASIQAYPGGWTRLGDELKEITGGATPLGANYPDKGVRFLRVQNVMPNYIDDSDLTYITKLDDEALSRSRLKRNDVLLTITGVSYGKSAVVTEEFAGSNINQHSVRMELKNERFRPHFISAFLNSKAGKLQSDQNITGVTRPALDYEAIRRFRIPLVSDHLQLKVAEVVMLGQHKYEIAKKKVIDAEKLLLKLLYLDNWSVPEPLTYVRCASEIAEAQRLDSEFFQPKVPMLQKHLGANYKLVTLGDIGVVDSGRTVPYSSIGTIPIIRSGDLDDLERESRFLFAQPSEPIFYLEPEDVLISSIGFGSIGKIQVFNKTKQFGAVSEITVVRQKRLNPYYLMFYLRSQAGQMQINRFITGATGQLHLYPRNVKQIFAPEIARDKQDAFEGVIHSTITTTQDARALFKAAQRAIEIAIDISEDAALAYLEAETHSHATK